MITLRWAPFPKANVASYNIYRSIIGFEAPVIALSELNGLTLQLQLNGGSTQLFVFNLTTPIVDLINTTIQGGQAYLSTDGLSFYVRSNVRDDTGSVTIVGGTALTLLEETARTITQLSENFLLASVLANPDPTIILQYCDPDGVLQDWYAMTTVDPFNNESLKTDFQQPIAATGPLCVIEGIVMDPQGVRMVDVRVRATPLDIPYSTDGHLSNVSREPIFTLTGVDGRFSLPLLQGMIVTLEIDEIGYSKPIQVPKQSFVFINDLRVNEKYRYPLTNNLG